MQGTLAIMQRDLRALLLSPIGYVVLAGFWVVLGVIVSVTGVFEPGQIASLQRIFGFMSFLLAIFVPAICMRVLSEEYRSGTIETLMTAPISDAQMVLGKYLAAVGFFAVMLGGTLIYLVTMALFGSPDLGASLAGYLGLFLVGAAFAAFGLFASSLTPNQIVAFAAAAVPLLLLVSAGVAVQQNLSGVWRDVFRQISISRHLESFLLGSIEIQSVVYFLGWILLFVFLSIKMVESRRWR